MFFRKGLSLCVTIWMVLTSLGTEAQQINTDSLEKRYHRDSISARAKDTGNVYLSDTSVTSLVVKLEELTAALNKVNGTLRRGFDTTALAKELPYYENIISLIDDNLDNDYNQYNLRSLYVTKSLLIQIEKKMKGWQTDLIQYSKKMSQINADILALANDSSFRKMPEDTTLLYLYFQQYLEVSKKWNLTDSLHRITLKKVGVLQNRIAKAYINVSDISDDVSYRISNYKKIIWEKEESPLWQANSSEYRFSFFQSVSNTITRSFRVLQFYYKLTWGQRLLNIAIALGFFLWIFFNRRLIITKGNQELLTPLHFTAKRSWLPALLVFFTIAPFLYQAPPAFYVELLWFCMLIVATVMSWKDWSDKFRKYWIAILALFLCFGLSNVLVQSSLGERWVILTLNLIAIALGYAILKLQPFDKVIYPRYMREVLWLFILTNLLAIIFNAYGRFTLAKFLSNSSIIGVSLAVSLHILLELILEALYLQLEAHKSWKVTSYLHFNEIKDKFRNFLLLGAMLFWFFAIMWSLNVFDTIVETVKEWFSMPLELGNIQFTISNILTFVIIIWISTFLARLLTYFFGTTDQQFASTQKNKLGSWVLLLRMGIIGGGFLLAIGAAGIPTDKLTIIVGALGVGIGFGMQNIVNNLVSGLILAFEKPMQIGDVIELGTRIGTVKEIGIRSSKISTFEGSDIIVPNGEFISQQLVNWTHNNSYRRIELLIGVAYGTDLVKATEGIKQVLEANNDVMLHPPISILVHDFADSAVTFRILFWTNNYDRWTILKSEILKAVYQKFDELGVNIPFPQRDLHIKSLSEEAGRMLKPNA